MSFGAFHRPSRTFPFSRADAPMVVATCQATERSAMRIMLLNQSPRTASRGPAYDVEPIERLVNSYASPGTKIEIGFPENFECSEVFHTLGAQSRLNGLHHMIETPSIVRTIIWAAENR